MRPPAVMREAWQETIRQPVSAVMIALLGAAMCATTLLTVGRTVAAEEQLAARVESAGSRVITLSDTTQGEWLTSSVLRVAANADSLERAVGFLAPVDVSSAASGGQGQQVAAWGLIGRGEDVFTVVDGRAPGPGEAVVTRAAARTLALDGPSGAVVRGSLEMPVVGVYEARAPFEDLSGVLYAAPLSQRSVPSARFVAADAAQVLGVERLVLSLVGAPADAVAVDSPATLAQLQGQLGEDLGAYGRQMLVLVIGAGAGLTAVVVLADVLIRRAALGRRRALGCSRAALTSLVLLRSLYAVTAGIVTGCVVAVLVSNGWGAPVPLAFVAATATLAVLATLTATVPPALAAALRDPLAVLRTP